MWHCCFQNRPRLRFRDVKRFILETTKGHIRHAVSATRLNAIQRLAFRAEQPRATHADMGDHEIAHRIHRHPIGPDAAGKIGENADLGDAAIGRQ